MSLQLPKLDPRAVTEWPLAAFVDVETTGFSPERDEIIELAAVLFAFSPETGEIYGILDEYVGFREPTRSIPRAATARHGITRRMVKGHQLDAGRIKEILDRAGFIVAHNA